VFTLGKWISKSHQKWLWKVSPKQKWLRDNLDGIYVYNEESGYPLYTRVYNASEICKTNEMWRYADVIITKSTYGAMNIFAIRGGGSYIARDRGSQHGP